MEQGTSTTTTNNFNIELSGSDVDAGDLETLAEKIADKIIEEQERESVGD